ncbi:MAG: hypothetical protein V4657_07640 [Pseudomonadota bacterium]
MRPAYRDPAYARYLKRFIPASVLYVGAIILASTLIPDDAKASPLTIGIALLPGMACITMIWAMARLLVEMEDEYLRLIEIKKALIATGFALAVAATWGLLELYTDVQKLPVFLIFPMWCGGLAIAQFWMKARGA